MAAGIMDVTDIHIDVALTNFSLLQTNEEYIADQAAPVLTVEKERNKYWRYDLSHLYVQQTQLSPRSPAQEVDWNGDFVQYTGVEFGLAKLISERERDVADAPINLDQDSVTFLKESLLLDREFRVAATLNATTSYPAGNESQVANGWDTANGTPISDIQKAKVAVRASLRRANQMTISDEVAQNLAGHSTIIDLRKYTRDMAPDIGLPNPLLGLRLAVAMSRFISTDKQAGSITAANVTTNPVWGKVAVIHYVDPSPSLRSINHYVTFRNMNFTVRKWTDFPRKSDVIEVRYLEALNQIVSTAGVLYTGVIA